MNKGSGAVILMIAGAAFAQDIHLKTRTIRADEQSRPAPARQGRPGHRIVQFDHSPGTEDLDALLNDGYPVVSVLPDNGVVVATRDGRVAARAGVRWTGPLDAADKMSPELAGGDPIAVIVEFHADVARALQDEVAGMEGVTLERVPVLAANHAIAETSMARLEALAAHDEVAYIFPADPALLTDGSFNPCAGMLTASGPIPQFANIVHGWDKDADSVVHLGYAFGSITPKVPEATVRSEVVRALNEWSKHTNVVFAPAVSMSSARTVSIKFASGAHGDAFAFDGPGGILAHTFYPVPVNPESIAGDMHLDADENWHAGNDLDIYSVALHEAGHAIGLSHSDKPGDVMYPYYHSGMHLSANDIGAAQTLYGLPIPAAPAAPAPVKAPTPPTTPTTPAIHLTMDPVAATTENSLASLSGVVSGGVPPVSVQWQTDRGYGGQTTGSPAGWLARQIPLVNGVNSVSVTAFDSARQTSTQTVAITLIGPAPAGAGQSGGAPVSITITSPASVVTTANSATIVIAGTASGGQGISRIVWQTSGGASGTAAGTSPWRAAGVPLLTGTNTIVVRAYDTRGNTGWATLVVVRH
jgi:Matrixin